MRPGKAGDTISSGCRLLPLEKLKMSGSLKFLSVRVGEDLVLYSLKPPPSDKKKPIGSPTEVMIFFH